MFQFFRKLGNWFLDILLPKFCLNCGREGEYICKDCEVFLTEVENVLPGLISCWEYEGLMKKVINQIKRQGCFSVIDGLLEKAFARISLNLPEDAVITYVPMFKKRWKPARFNAAEYLAKKIGLLTGRKVVPLLSKVKDTLPQADLPPDLRIGNVDNAFSFSGSFRPEQVLLVDDYYSTGSTVNECRKVLQENGVKKVWVFTLACQLRM